MGWQPPSCRRYPTQSAWALVVEVEKDKWWTRARVYTQKRILESAAPAVLACFEVHHVRPGSAAAAEAMSVPPRRRAGLWPWLLMAAALQVVLGQPGLEVERQPLRALIKVALLNQEPAGKPITLEGLFVGGSAGYAEGKLMQVRRCPTGGLSILTQGPAH